MAEPAGFLVIGAGGLGCPALLGLTSLASPWPITIADGDTVELGNLQRQVLFTTADLGAPKAEAACHRLRARRPELELRAIAQRLDATSLDGLLAALPAGSVALECSDDAGLKFAANDLCLTRGIPLVVAGVLGWRGQVMGIRRGTTCLRCLYETPPPPELAPACAEAGVIGSAAGLLGYFAAALAVRLAEGEDVAGELFDLDLRGVNARTLRPSPRAGCPACAGVPRTESTPRACAASA